MADKSNPHPHPQTPPPVDATAALGKVAGVLMPGLSAPDPLWAYRDEERALLALLGMLSYRLMRGLTAKGVQLYTRRGGRMHRPVCAAPPGAGAADFKALDAEIAALPVKTFHVPIGKDDGAAARFAAPAEKPQKGETGSEPTGLRAFANTAHTFAAGGRYLASDAGGRTLVLMFAVIYAVLRAREDDIAAGSARVRRDAHAFEAVLQRHYGGAAVLTRSPAQLLPKTWRRVAALVGSGAAREPDAETAFMPLSAHTAPPPHVPAEVFAASCPPPREIDGGKARVYPAVVAPHDLPPPDAPVPAPDAAPAPAATPRKRSASKASSASSSADAAPQPERKRRARTKSVVAPADDSATALINRATALVDRFEEVLDRLDEMVEA